MSGSFAPISVRERVSAEAPSSAARTRLVAGSRMATDATADCDGHCRTSQYARPPLASLLREQIGPQRDHVVVHGVARTEEQRHRPGLRRIEDWPPCVRMRFAFGNVTALEFHPANRIVAEPSAQRRAGRNASQPAVKLQRLFPHAARPEAFGEEASAIGLRGRIINPLDRNGRLLALRAHGVEAVPSACG